MAANDVVFNTEYTNIYLPIVRKRNVVFIELPAYYTQVLTKLCERKPNNVRAMSVNTARIFLIHIIPPDVLVVILIKISQASIKYNKVNKELSNDSFTPI